MKSNRENGEARARWVDDQLKALDASPSPECNTEAAWRQWQARLEPDVPRPGWRWISLAAVLALVGALGFLPAARAAGGRMLSLFRITQVTALPLDVNGSAPIADRSTAHMIGQLLSDEITVTHSENNEIVPSALAASQMAGFTLRAPAVATMQYRVQGEKDFQMVVDRARAQAVLASAGVAGVTLPPDLDGATISVHMPRIVNIMMGDCSSWVAKSHRSFPGPPSGTACTVMGEGPSPTVDLPPGLDMEKIAEVGLQLLGMSATEAQQYCQTVDWRSTLVVPFPRGEAQSHNVNVDGVQGIVLVRNRAEEGSHYVLLWSRQGMLYSIAGPGDGSQGLQLAAQLPPA